MRSFFRIASTTVAIALVLSVTFEARSSRRFWEEQLTHSRVVTEVDARSGYLEDLFEKHGLAWPPEQIFIRVIKRDRNIELWASNGEDEAFQWVRNYPVCYFSGHVGPKRYEGDLQTPEGFYRVVRYNPRSRNHVSLGVSYPNEADQILGEEDNLGGDIMIHGGCGSVGCLAITDERVAELYVVAISARANGQYDIPIHIFPAHLDEEGMQWLSEVSGEHMAFWENLRPAYLHFEATRTLADFEVDRDGNYTYPEIMLPLDGSWDD